MKIQLFKQPIAAIALLVLLSLQAFAGLPVLVDAASTKAPNVLIKGSGSITLRWNSGKTQTYTSSAYANLGGLDAVTIVPTHGYHIDAFAIDDKSQDILDEDGFGPINIQAKNSISASFMSNAGVDDVETGSTVEAYPDPLVGLIFGNVLTGGFAYAYESDWLPPNYKRKSWDITTNAIFDQSVTVILVLSQGDFDPSVLRLVRTEDWLARADVNSDGKVDGTDVSIVANANPSEVGDPKYDARLDQEPNGVIDNTDVNTVNNYIGESVWIDITLRVVVNNELGLVYLYGLTDRFSIFGIR